MWTWLRLRHLVGAVVVVVAEPVTAVAVMSAVFVLVILVVSAWMSLLRLSPLCWVRVLWLLALAMAVAAGVPVMQLFGIAEVCHRMLQHPVMAVVCGCCCKYWLWRSLQL